MRRLLLCAGVYGQRKALEGLNRAVQARRPDGVLFAGGVLPLFRHYTARTTLWDMDREDAQFVQHFFEELGKLGVFSAVIPGTTDTPVEEFLRIGMHAEVEFSGVHVVHATLVEQRDLAVCGIGGHISGNGCHEPDWCPRILAAYHLRKLWTVKQPRRALLLPSPPPGTLGGPEGNAFAGELIDSLHPTLCVVGGTTQRRGIERVAGTLVVNPGALADGSAAWLDWGRDSDHRVEFLDLRTSEPIDVAASAF